MSDPVFACRSASVSLPLRGGLRPIISDISLELRQAEFLSIVGPSGTGKTTLLRMLGGLLQPTSGSVSAHGEELSGPPEGVVIVFQDYGNALLQWRSVAANVAFGIERTLPRAQCAQRVREALAMVDLLERADDYPWSLSGGMQQRVQIARALALQPSVLLMDEPFAALDAQTREIMQRELLKIWAQKRKTVLFITHQIDEAVYLADRVLVFSSRPGRVAADIAIPFPRPRELSLKRSPEFLKIVDEIWTLIEQEVVASMQVDAG